MGSTGKRCHFLLFNRDTLEVCARKKYTFTEAFSEKKLFNYFKSSIFTQAHTQKKYSFNSEYY